MDFKKPGTIRRRPVSLSQESLVKTGSLQPDGRLPLLVQPATPGVDLVFWAVNNREFIETHLLRHGGILFRDFRIDGVAEFERFIEAASETRLLEYTYRSTPRSLISGRIYTSTEYPAHQFIPLHNEMSYSRAWPMKIWFFCLTVAERGGETPIADSRKVLERIRPAVSERFIKEGVMYVRNYGDGIDLSWQTAFQTEDRAEAEEYCRNAGIEYEWRGESRLRTRQVCQAVAAHPVTNEVVWFNQAHLFHISSLEPAVREVVLKLYQEEDLPRNTYYGSGAPIEDSALDEIRAAYEQEAVTFSWQQGDILMLDNMLTAHGRKPYTGARKVVVGMCE